jgi:uncharacterized protein YuzB (UPF0349 family)
MAQVVHQLNVKSGKLHAGIPTEQCNFDDQNKKNFREVDEKEAKWLLENGDATKCGFCYSPKYARLRGEKP